MAHVETWVSDRLHDILGMSDKHIAKYMVGLAQKSTTKQDLIEKLKNTGTVDVDESMVSFLNELHEKVRSGPVEGNYKEIRYTLGSQNGTHNIRPHISVHKGNIEIFLVNSHNTQSRDHALFDKNRDIEKSLKSCGYIFRSHIKRSKRSQLEQLSVKL